MLYKVIPLKEENTQEQSQELLRVWEEESGQKTNLCIEKFCTNPDIEGVVVLSADHRHTGTYIAPLCSNHRDSTRELLLDKSFKVVKIEK